MFCILRLLDVSFDKKKHLDFVRAEECANHTKIYRRFNLVVVDFVRIWGVGKLHYALEP